MITMHAPVLIIMGHHAPYKYDTVLSDNINVYLPVNFNWHNNYDYSVYSRAS